MRIFEFKFGIDEFEALRDMSVRNCQVSIIVFPSIHDSVKSLEHSFSHLYYEMHRILRIKDCDDAPCIIAFTKSDLLSESASNNSQIDTKTKEILIRRLIRNRVMLNCGIVHMSAKTGQGTEEIMKEIINRYLIYSTPKNPTKKPNYQNWNTEIILQKIISNEKEIYNIISNQKRGEKCNMM